MCRSSAAVKLLASESEGRGFESRRQLFFFFFFFIFFNIHTSDKLEIFFDHSILVNAALIALTHGVYTIDHETGVYSMRKPYALVSGIIIGYIIITIYEVVYKIERVSE